MCKPLLIVLLAIGAVMLFEMPAVADETGLEKIKVFDTKTLGFTKYRIPGIIATTKGTLIAFCEARTLKGGDWDPSYFQIKRSFDGGRTWDKPRSIAGDGKVCFNNPVMIVDRDTSAIHVFHCTDYGRVFYMTSDDDGATYSPPRELTTVFEKLRPQWDWKVVATGPNHGTQLRNGRLLMPVWLSITERRHAPTAVTTLYSDDHGRTWNCGDLAIKDTPVAASPSETLTVELSDGRVMLNTRAGSPRLRRAFVVGPDGATGWSEPSLDLALVEPRCNASMIRYQFPQQGKPGIILFANPDNATEPMANQQPDGNGIYRNYARKNLTLQLSCDDGATWPIKKSIEPGRSGYSDLAVGADGMIYCLYEVVNDIVLARIPLEWIESARRD